MMKFTSLFATVILLFSTCSKVATTTSDDQKAGSSGNGDGSGASSSMATDKALLAQVRPLPDCTPRLAGKFIFLQSEKSFFICINNEWMPIDLKAKDGVNGKDAIAAGINFSSTGKWKAILSSSTINAIDSVNVNGPVCNSEDKVIAADAYHFLRGP
jgi:hypothetical protein